MDLSTDKKINYSPFERRVFFVLAANPKTTVVITDTIYGHKSRPFNARQSVLGALVSLSKKVKKNREPFAIKKSKRKGPHPIHFWVEQ